VMPVFERTVAAESGLVQTDDTSQFVQRDRTARAFEYVEREHPRSREEEHTTMRRRVEGTARPLVRETQTAAVTHHGLRS
jgi:hypothetical protein